MPSATSPTRAPIFTGSVGAICRADWLADSDTSHRAPTLPERDTPGSSGWPGCNQPADGPDLTRGPTRLPGPRSRGPALGPGRLTER